MTSESDLAAAVDVFHHHDGVIHQHPDAEGQPAQGKDIQRYAGKVHQRHGEEQTHGDGHRHHEGGTEIPQEQQEDQHGQHRADQQIFRHGRADAVNIHALIRKGRDGNRGIGFDDLSEGRLNIFGGFRGGNIGLFQKGDQHAVVAVDPGVDIAAVVDHGNIGHIA